jgi:hypothetical protein
MKQIPLHGGRFALVDDEDFAALSGYRWHVDSNGYARRSVPGSVGKHAWMHRSLLPLPSGQLVDHKNRDKLDNRRENLRPSSPAGNSRNRAAIGGSSAFKGVTWNAQCGRWQASIKVAYQHSTTPPVCSNPECVANFEEDVEAAAPETPDNELALAET